MFGKRKVTGAVPGTTYSQWDRDTGALWYEAASPQTVLGNYMILKGKMNRAMYQYMLRGNSMSTAKKLNLGSLWMFNIILKHAVKVTQGWFLEKRGEGDWHRGGNFLTWISLKIYRSFLKLLVHQRDPQNLEELETVCQGELQNWTKLLGDVGGEQITFYISKL